MIQKIQKVIFDYYLQLFLLYYHDYKERLFDEHIVTDVVWCAVCILGIYISQI